jgi:SAM-dependent methyltransferase
MMATAAIQSEIGPRSARLRFVVTIFVGSFLLFLVQPMIARMALPRLGGAPAVWNSAMLVYQALLLAGYAYAHWITRAAPRVQAGMHLAAFALAALALPIGLVAAAPPADANPILWVPWLLLISIGPLFLVVSAQGPLMQHWFARSGGADPYPLYAASNLGSFAGLLVYPLLVEPLLPVTSQRLLWSGAYLTLALLVGWCALGLPQKAPARVEVRSGEQPSRRSVATWILLAAVPSGLILSTTLHLTTDIVAVPLLWVVPLGLYLLSFTFAFAADRRAADRIGRLAPITLLAAACGLVVDASSMIVIFAAAALLNLFVVSVAIHSMLYERRPEPQHLTLFYLAMSVGGVLGGIFCALVAPLIFDWTYENPLLLAAAAFLLFGRNPFAPLRKLWANQSASGRLTRWGVMLVFLISPLGKGVFGLPSSTLAAAVAGCVISVFGILAIGNRWLFTASVAALMLSMGGWDKLALSASPGKMSRSFFGVYSIRPGPNNSRLLVHGTTIHGIQNLGSEARERMATSYYAPPSGVGLAMVAAPRLFGDRARIGIVGLGSGTLACYARPGQHWTFYEIDPLIARIASDPSQFTFLSRCLPGVPVVIGDARLTLEHGPAAADDLLVVDAFSSDAVPMHLLTTEAFAAYRRHLRPGGLLLVHISNRYLDLKPVVAAAAAAGGWQARIRTYLPDASQRARNEGASIWIALSPAPRTVDRLVALSGAQWQPLPPEPGFAAWTDDHASLLPLIGRSL